jgi:hypothetical protein
VNATEEADEEDVISETETPDTRFEFVNQTVINASNSSQLLYGCTYSREPLKQVGGNRSTYFKRNKGGRACRYDNTDRRGTNK